ncbi:apolipoprotein D-like isoform X1 [Epinephelus lanceolatus]|uniref:apolipoprotein D-like isoform X1 n=2 Tax=Epinephelus lanceolatus TaxID=310571 RepID=UPI001447E3DF|nr:apolipoprotein D-like isoform X1 [Epinephelus lanceolatus]
MFGDRRADTGRGEKMKAIQVISLTLLCIFAASAQVLKFGKCPTPAVQANFDPTRYVGKWYEIMKLPTAFQKGECGTATYSLKGPGVLGVLNRELLDDGSINSIVGQAKVRDPAVPAKLEVSFSGTPPGPYWVLSSDYEGHSLVYGCTDFGLFRMELSWILSREPTLSEETLDQLHGILSSIGVNVDKMIPTNQDETYCIPMDQ